MSLLPVYDPKAFDGIDLRKYHIRDIKDIIKFLNFVTSRMEEAEFILKKFNNEYATFQTVSAQLQAKMEKQQRAYGSPNFDAKVNVEDTTEIQKVDESAEQLHEELLDEIRSAVAEETLVPETEEEDPNERAQAILGNYKVIMGKKGPMFYRTGSDGKTTLVSKKDVPEDIKEALINAAGE